MEMRRLKRKSVIDYTKFIVGFLFILISSSIIYIALIDQGVKIRIDKDKYNKWKGVGALSSTAVEKLIEGTYVYEKYTPQKAEGSEKSASEVSESNTE